MIKITPIIPKRRLIDPRRQQQAIDLGLADAAAGALVDFESTAATWEHDPSFFVKPIANGVLVGTKDDVWNMLDKGTKAHDIVAKRIALRFPGGPYRPKTRPGFIGSQSGGPSGDMIFRPRVHHPGTKPRGWSKMIRKKWQSQLGRFVQRRINEAMR